MLEYFVPRKLFSKLFFFLIFWLVNGPLNAQTPAKCQTVYAVHDQAVRDTQFFSYHLTQQTLKPLGALQKRIDIEGLSVHPKTYQLYATSGQTQSKLYTVDAQTGELSTIGEIGFDDVVGLAFHADGTLWGWAKQGLLQINVNTGAGTLILAEPHPIDALAWNKEGTALYGAAYDKKDDHSILWKWQKDSDSWQIACQNLPPKVEGLETRPDGLFVYGFHKDKQLKIHFYEASTCQTQSTGQIETPYNDIEGIAWPNRTTCEPTPLEQVQTYLESLDGIESVDIQTDGTIHYTQNGENHHAQLADEIVKGPPPPDGLLTLTSIADANGDGIDDLKITYPNGDQQVVYYFGTIKEPSVKLQITSPIQNESVAENRILVEGTYEGPSNTGITINGISALVNEGRFIANNVPLETGENTLTATLTTREGETTTHSISITSQGTPSLLTLSASPSGGLAPLSVTFEYSLNTDTRLSNLVIDFEGDGTNDFTTRSSSATIQYNYHTPGIYVAKMQLTDNKR
ncbi:secreted protein [Beggiatoa sp. PS]|nr:secreted protein [Beggiatoa sp. PS]